jgi:N12 class adenine-specific DNA methylase
MVLGQWSRKDTLYGGEGFSVTSTGNLGEQLKNAIGRLPAFAKMQTTLAQSTSVPAFVPPPPERHIDEGSFFIGDDKAIYQIEGGQGVPVVYSGTALKADGTMTGKRLAGLVGLRDRARRVLQSQNEGWPTAHRDEARRELNRAYDQFWSIYGPINKTTFGGTTDGSIIRRMPNIVKFKEDPDAMLVMSLEDYDEVTGKAAKAAIMQRDVVGKTPPVTHVRSAEEGLLVSLNQKGSVDLPYIASLYNKPESQIIEELGDLIFLDPASTTWQTADAYLSGNVREKLAIAEAAGPEYARNAAALRSVQPEDVLPGDIDANLGAPWIPESDIQAFAAELFRVDPASVPVGHLKKDAVWSLDAGYAATASVAATSEYGTQRANGTGLLELALNMKTPTIYDTINHGDREERVVNQEATMAAREKQKAIKDRFRSWVFAEPNRTERLVRIYNDTYNNLRPRLFDGSHLDFPGMNQAIHLRPHQDDAVWRGMSSGNTLLAHVVGAGKTFTMAATGMKMKQAGLIKKPMYVVPNHLLEQFSREFMQLYPNARLLVATKEDLSRDKRKMLTAKIASGEWDGIIVTHSSFERIGMSRDYQQQFLLEQIAEYDELLREHAAERGKNRNLIKTIEKQKAARVERLKGLLAEDKKDDGLVFDDLGVDHVFVDEAHYFKNLETPTKMDRVAGIQTGGSERAFDMYMKARYLGEQHPGHGVTFATGTPISNTMVEMYTMQRFLDPEGLKSRGIEHFDAWAATFGEVVDTMEITPDGAGLRPRSRFARFTNLPELQQMFRTFSDVQTAEMLNLPRPRLQGGKPIVVACPMSEEQHDLQEALVKRYERLRSEKVDPREDNALAITTDGRKLATDARMLSATAPDFPESKINRLVENVAATWQRTTPTRGTQMIFADMGVNPTQWGYSPYEEIIKKLVANGIPRDQIAAIGDAESDAKKQALFEKVRQGSVRVLIGSTQKMGTGTNVQKRLVALHHLDAPWKPAEVEQRDGRILRQGNENKEVAIYRYVTEGSFDAYMWVRRESCSFDCVACRKTLTAPAVPSAVAYRHVRCQQRQGAKLSRQRNPTLWVQSGTARNALSCQHQGGRGARLGGMTNLCEPTINPVNANRLKVPTSLNQKVCSRLLLSTLGAHGHYDCRGRVGV